MATEKILIFDEAGNAKRMKVRIARFLDSEPVTDSDKENIRTTLDVDDSLSGTFTTPLSVTSASDSSFTGGGDVGIGAAPGSTRLRVSGGSGQLFKVDDGGNALVTVDATGAATMGAGAALTLDTGGNLILKKGGGAYLQLKDASAVRGAINVSSSDGLIFTTGSSFTERWRINASGNLQANSTGIDFSATGDGVGSGQAEILDDFETGSWSPQFYSSGGTLTAAMDVRSARYVKIGHMVTVMCYIRTSNVDNSSASGTLRISGLPFGVAGSNNYTAVSVGHALNWSTAPAGGYTESSASNIILDKRASIGGDLSPMAPSDLTNGSGTNNEVMLTATYCSF